MLRRPRLLAPFLLLALVASLPALAGAEGATVREYRKTFRTYPFSDPDPIPNAGRIYPYFRFDGFTDRPVEREWTVVELENPWIRVTVLPEVGGKIWSAVEKSTGKPFLYGNQVVKFRDVAMRGPWTSGGIEANYGIIGHTPNCATPGRLPHAAEPRRQRLRRHRRPRPPDPHALAARGHAARGQGVLHDHVALAQRDAARAALLHVDERRHQGRGQPAVRLPRHPLHRPRGRGEPVADRREGAATCPSTRRTTSAPPSPTTCSAAWPTSSPPTGTTTTSAWAASPRATRSSARRSGSGASPARG